MLSSLQLIRIQVKSCKLVFVAIMYRDNELENYFDCPFRVCLGRISNIFISIIIYLFLLNEILLSV